MSDVTAINQLVIKYNELKNEIKKLHPYDVPEIVEINVNSMNKPYLDWLVDSTL